MAVQVHGDPRDHGRAQTRDSLLQSLRKPSDGLIARTINRRISLRLTGLLMGLPVSPNHVTFVTLLVVLVGTCVAASATAATPWRLAVGAVLWQLASILDGVDGELARLKNLATRVGAWFDTLVDDFGMVAFLLGFGYGLWQVTGQAGWLTLAGLTAAIQLVLCGCLYRRLVQIGAATHTELAWSTSPLAFLGRRDYCIFSFMVMTVAGLERLAISVAFVTTLFVSLAYPRRA